MSNIKVIEIKKSVFENNDAEAEKLREKLKKKGVFLLNLMSSPGSGKTSVLVRTIKELNGEIRTGVMEADIDSAVDAETIAATGVKTIQIHTGGMCHLDAGMTEKGLAELDIEDLDLVVLENVGNLVCTAEQDTGADVNVEILSIPEGDDKPLKYPLMFTVCQCVLINKTDTREWFDFDDNEVIRRIHALNPSAEIFFVSGKTGEGFEEWIKWIKKQVK